MTGLGIFRDPVSGLTHLFGAFFGMVGLAYLWWAHPEADATTAASILIFGVSLVLLYAASAVYHLAKVSPAQQALLRRVDHAMIPVFIAGTYTPFCLVALRGTTVGMVVLIAIWALALGGMVKSVLWLHAPRALTAGLFVTMGWMVVLAVMPLSRALSGMALGLLIGGGLAYSVGALVYARKWPDPFPPLFGFHEIWHLFVLAGSGLHFAAVATLLER